MAFAFKLRFGAPAIMAGAVTWYLATSIDVWLDARDDVEASFARTVCPAPLNLIVLGAARCS